MTSLYESSSKFMNAMNAGATFMEKVQPIIPVHDTAFTMNFHELSYELSQHAS